MQSDVASLDLLVHCWFRFWCFWLFRVGLASLAGTRRLGSWHRYSSRTARRQSREASKLPTCYSGFLHLGKPTRLSLDLSLLGASSKDQTKQDKALPSTCLESNRLQRTPHGLSSSVASSSTSGVMRIDCHSRSEMLPLSTLLSRDVTEANRSGLSRLCHLE